MIKGFEDAFTDLQSEFVSLCMEYTNGSVDKIYIYIYQDTSQKMFNAIFVKGQNVMYKRQECYTCWEFCR